MKPLTRHDRHNIKRRYGCDWKVYTNSMSYYGPECQMCGAITNKLRPDTLRADRIPPPVCGTCWPFIKHFVKGDPGTRARIKAYLFKGME